MPGTVGSVANSCIGSLEPKSDGWVGPQVCRGIKRMIPQINLKLQMIRTIKGTGFCERFDIDLGIQGRPVRGIDTYAE